MDLELGLKITKTRDDVTSISELQIAKDRAGPVFISRETKSMFILTAHLKGYKRKNIDIKINEDGSQIAISGKKPIQEMMMMGWVMSRKEVGIGGFEKVFKIPDGVILDRIKAKYDEHESILNIVMPKLRKGICGVEIEEVKEEESDREKLESGQCEADHIRNNIGETSQAAASKEPEVQETVDSGNVVKKEGEECEKMLAADSGAIVEETVHKEIEKSKFKTEDRDEESVRNEVGKEGFQTMKIPETEQNLADYDSRTIGETSQEVSEKSVVQTLEETESHVEDMEGLEAGKMLPRSNGVIEEDIIGERKQKEIEKPEYETEDTRKESLKEEISEERYEALKKLEPDQVATDHIPNDIVGTSKKMFKETEIKQMEEAEGVGKKMDAEESGRMPTEVIKVIQKKIIEDSIKKDIEEPKIETEDRIQDSVRENGKEGFEALEPIMKEFPKRLPETAVKESEGLMEETDVTKEAMIKRKSKEFKPLAEEEEGGQTRKIQEKARRVIEKDIYKEMIKKETEKHKIETKDENQQYLQDGIVKGGLEASTSIIQESPKKQGEMSLDGSKGKEVVKMEENKEVMEAVKMVEGEKTYEMNEEKNRIIQKDALREKFQKESEESYTKTKAGKGKDVPESIVKGTSAVSGTLEESLDQMVEATAKEGEGSKRMHIEASEISDRDKIGDRIQKETRGPKIGPEDKDLVSGKRNDDSRGFHVMETLSKESPEQLAGVLLDGSTEFKVEKRTVTKDIKEESAETQDSMEKGKRERHEKQVEVGGRFRKDISTETTQAETGKPKIETKARDQQYMHEEMSKERFEESWTAKRELPMRVAAGSQTNGTDGPKDTKIEEMNEAKEEAQKRKSAETKVVADAESSIQQKVQESESERMYKTKEITETLQEVKEAKHPKSSETLTVIPDRKVPPTKDIASSPKVVSAEFKDLELGTAYDKARKKEPLPPKLECTEGDESKKGSVEQDSLKEKGTKEVEERDQCIQTLESTEPLLIADQITEQLQLISLPSTQQSEVEEKEKIFEGSEAQHPSYQESTKRDLETDIKDSAKMKERQEAEKIETLQPEIPLKESLSKEEVTAQEKILGGLEVEHRVQEENEKGEGPDITEGEEAKEAAEQSIQGERGKVTQTTEGEKPEIKEMTPKFEGAEVCKVYQPPAMQETAEREYHRESVEVTPKGRLEPPETIDTISKAASKEYKGVKPSEETETSQTEELSPKDPRFEESGEKKDGTKVSKKMCCPLVVAGSAIIFYLIVSFVRHRRARKS